MITYRYDCSPPPLCCCRIIAWVLECDDAWKWVHSMHLERHIARLLSFRNQLMPEPIQCGAARAVVAAVEKGIDETMVQ